MEDRIAKAVAGFVIGAVVDAALVQFGLPKHAAKVIGAIAGALA